MKTKNAIKRLREIIKEKGYTLDVEYKGYEHLTLSHGTVRHQKINFNTIIGKVNIKYNKKHGLGVLLGILAHEVGHILDIERLFRQYDDHNRCLTPEQIIHNEIIATSWALRYIRYFAKESAIPAWKVLRESLDTYYVNRLGHKRRDGYLKSKLDKRPDTVVMS